MATEFARRLAVKRTNDALENVCSVPLTRAHTKELSAALRQWRRSMEACKRVYAEVDEEVVVFGES